MRGKFKPSATNNGGQAGAWRRAALPGRHAGAPERGGRCLWRRRRVD